MSPISIMTSAFFVMEQARWTSCIMMYLNDNKNCDGVYRNARGATEQAMPIISTINLIMVHYIPPNVSM